MDELLELGRILFGTVFFMSGIGHFAAKDAMVGYGKAMGAPAPETLVPVSGAMILAGSISIALGIFGDVGALLLIAFLIPTTYFMHAYWKIDDPEQRQMQQIHFNKNLSLLGAAIVIFWLFNQAGDLPYTLTDSLFDPF